MKKQVFPPQGRCHLAEHQNAENTDVGAQTVAGSTYYDAFGNGATLVSQTIITTKRCCVVVVTLCILNFNTQQTQIRRGGVDRTIETTISANQFAVVARGHLQYATEILDAGTYIYSLVNSSGVARTVYGSAMKIVAVSA